MMIIAAIPRIIKEHEKYPFFLLVSNKNEWEHLNQMHLMVQVFLLLFRHLLLLQLLQQHSIVIVFLFRLIHFL